MSLALAALLVTAQFGMAQQSAVVLQDGTNLRSAPSVDSAAIGVLRKGTLVHVLDTHDAWSRVSAGTLDGWLRESAIERQPDGSGQKATPPPPAITAAIQPRRERLLTVGILGSVTPATMPGTTAERHVAVIPLVMYGPRAFTIYAAPELGAGADYTSMMWGGGIGVPLVSTDRLSCRALAGYTSYGEHPHSSDLGPSRASWSERAPTVGGLVTLRAIGSFRIAYYGQYLFGLGSSANLRFARHSFGVVF